MNTWYNRIHVNIGGKCLVVVVSAFLDSFFQICYPSSFFQICDPSFKDHGSPHVCLIKFSNSGKDQKLGSMNMQHALRRNERLLPNNQVVVS